MSATALFLLFVPPALTAEWIVGASEGGDFETIQDALDAAGFGDRILVSPGVYYEALDYAGLEVEVIGIDGAGVTTIDASGLGEPAVSFATGEGVGSVLSGFTLVNDSDAGVRIVSASPTLEALVLAGLGVGTGLGGAVYIEGGAPSFTDCEFRDNSAALGGHIYVAGYGSLTVSGGSFEGGVAESGGAIHLSSLALADLDDVILFDNLAAEDGGAVDMGSQASLTLRDVSFQQNTAGRDGGAVKAGRGATVESRGGLWFGNDAVSGDGGALRIADECSLSFVEDRFSANIAGDSGGAVALAESANTLALSSVTFGGNSAGRGGAIAAGSYDELTIDACDFQSNEVAGDGGAIHLRSEGADGALSITDTLFQEGSAARGGALWLEDASGGFSASLSGCGFTLNSAASGGAVYTLGVTDLVIDGGDITQNTASDDGGGLALEDSFVTLREVSLSANAASSGGAVHGEGSGTLALEGCELSENTALVDGGAVAYFGTSLAITDSALLGNRAASSGGGVYAETLSALTLERASLLDNVAAQDGGGVYAWGVTYVASERSLYCGNEGRDGGALWLREVGSEARVVNSRFLENAASRYGGGLGVISSPELSVANNAFVSNGASVSGAAAFANSVGLSFVNNAVIDSQGDEALYGNSDTLAAASLGYNDWYGGSGDERGGALADASEIGGLSVAPGFEAYAAGDCDSDLRLDAASPLVDAGDPELTDPDGSRSDVGAYGGPDAPVTDEDGDGFAADRDCDDGDPAIYPGADDDWYDGVDSDCGGEDDYDQDGDGAARDADCDDEDGARYPGAVDIPGDGIDQDCDGDDAFQEDTGDGGGDGEPADDTAVDESEPGSDIGSGKRCSIASPAASSKADSSPGAMLALALLAGAVLRRRRPAGVH